MEEPRRHGRDAQHRDARHAHDNVRESAVLGLVGAGGIGLVLDAALNVFQWRAVAAVLVAVFAVVLFAEVAVTAIRNRVL